MRYPFFILVALLLLSQAVYAADIVDLSTLSTTGPAPGLALAPEVALGKEVRRGVEAWLWVTPADSDLSLRNEQSAALFRHEARVQFVDIRTGEQVDGGQAALRVFLSDAEKPQTVRLEEVEGGWKAEVDLALDRENMLKVGTKLADGKKRIYRFFYPPQPAPEAGAAGGVSPSPEAEAY